MLIITGSLAYDYIMGFPGSFSDHVLPEHNHNINLSFIVNSFAKRRGGTAGNASYTLGLLQTEHTLFSFAGNDFNEYKKAFEDIGVTMSSVAIDPNDNTATGFAMADKDQNQIWGFYYGAASRNVELKLQSIASKDDLVLIGPQGAEGSLSFVKQCIDLGIPYMFDPGFILTQVEDTDLEHGLNHATYIIGNDYEINLMQKRITEWDVITADKIIITTLGAEGAVIAEGDKKYTIKPVQAERVAATTGAGDAWRGGFLAGLARGFDLQTCGEMGAVASAYAVEHVGTQEHVYTKKVFAERYKATYNKVLEL
jgi:adenosine kinase